MVLDACFPVANWLIHFISSKVRKLRYCLNSSLFLAPPLSLIFIVFFSLIQGCYVGDQGLAAVGRCCKRLEELNLRFCEGLTDEGLVELTIGCGKSIKSLGVAACARITDVALGAVGSHCKSLEKLSLDSELNHDEGVLAVAHGCPLLRVLRLQCSNVTDKSLMAVGQYCSALELLTLQSFQKVTDMLVISWLFLRIHFVF